MVLDFDAESYAWVITRTKADWVALKITAKALSDQVKTLRSSLTFDIDKPFDTQLAYLYRGPVLRHSAELIQAANFRSAVAF